MCGNLWSLSVFIFYSPLQADLSVDDEKLCGHIKHVWRRQFCGLIATIDHSLERIVTAVQNELTNDRDTLVFITSDNGGSTWFGGLGYPFRGAKGTPFNGGLRVPALFLELPKKGSNSAPKPGVYDQLFHVSDIVPTILGMLDIDASDQCLDGKDLHCALPLSSNLQTNCDSIVHHRDEAVLEFLHPDENVFGESILAYIEGDMKLVEGNIADGYWLVLSSKLFLIIISYYYLLLYFIIISFNFRRYIGSTNKWMDFEYRGGISSSLNGALSIVQGVIGSVYECFVALLEFIFGQGKCDR